MTQKHNILITGASGFIGGHVVKYFVAKRLKLACLVRKNSDLSFIDHLPIKIIYGDISDPESISRAMEGIDAVIHIAGMTTDWGKSSTFKRINVDGTMNVMKAAHLHKINNVIITGSISSYGEEHSEEVKDELSPYNSHYPYFLHKIFPNGMNHYRDSKRLATKMAIEFAQNNDINLSVMEPVWVYGENEFSSGFYEYIKSASKGVFAMPGSKNNNFHIVYAQDLAEAYYRAFDKKIKGVHRYIIGNETAVNMNILFGEFCREAGARKPLNLPKAMTYPIGFFLELLATIFKFKQPPLLTRARVNMFYDNIEYNPEKAYKILSFKASTPMEPGIKKTVRWYKQNKYL